MPRETPRERIAVACRAGRREELLTACLDLLGGREVERGLLRVLAGRLDPDWAQEPVHRYWLRVWALRGLLWSWDPRALPALGGALSDERWRPRESCGSLTGHRPCRTGAG